MSDHTTRKPGVATGLPEIHADQAGATIDSGFSQTVDSTQADDIDRRAVVERPDTVHGRLMESVHLSGYSFERVCSELEWLLYENRWKQCGGGFGSISEFMATLRLADFKFAIEQRKKLAKQLKALEASNRATARLLGVDEGTVRKDTAENSAPGASRPFKDNEIIEASAENSAPGWFQDGSDPAAIAKAADRRAKGEAKRLKARADYDARKEQGSRVDDLQALIDAEKQFGVVYGDPPWQFEDDSGTGAAENHYNCMSLDAIKALPVEKLAAPDCALLLWVPSPLVSEALEVIKAWGFTYTTFGFNWVKLNKSGVGYFTGMGRWTRANSEVCLLATRGKPTRLAMDVPQLIVAPVAGHSAKPVEVHARIERLLAGPYLELFARQERPGWTTWGNEIMRTEFLKALRS